MLLPPANEETAHQSTLAWLGRSATSLVRTVGSKIMDGVSSVDDYLGGAVETKGTYTGYGQVEDMNTDVNVDLSQVFIVCSFRKGQL